MSCRVPWRAQGTVPAVNVTKPAGRSLIFLVDRGPRDAASPCYFLLKVRAACLPA
jgi:hypothetical protein